MALSWRLFIRNRRRYKFVISALAAGVAGLIFVINIGDSVEKKVAAHLTLLGGATILSVERSDFDSLHPGEYDSDDVARLKGVPNVVEVAPVVSLENVRAFQTVNEMKTGLAGVDPSFWETIMAVCREGRLITDADNEYRLKVCVLGEEVAAGLFGDVSPVSKSVSVDNIALQVVGILGGIQGPDTRRRIFIPLTLARSLFADMYSIKEMRIRMDHWDVVERSAGEIAETLGSAHPGHESGIRVRFYPERIKRVRNSVQMVKWLSVLTCSVVVVLGCIGASYLMRSVVQERTREIGLKKAVGWTDSMVLLQFLLESLTVFVLGGGIGVIGTVISCLILEFALGFTIETVLLLTSALASLIALGICGLGTGFYPALRAANMDPIEAMRFE